MICASIDLSKVKDNVKGDSPERRLLDKSNET